MWFKKKNTIENIEAMQILDSRGNPTIMTTVYSGGFSASASVPSGASTGSHEAVELRDSNAKYYNGLSVLNNVKYIAELVNPSLKGVVPVDNQVRIDELLYNLDGTDNKSKIGANTMLSVSLACARLSAKMLNIPLWRYLNQISGIDVKPSTNVRPMLNIINGGAHATNNLDFQEYIIIPKGVTFSDRMHVGFLVFNALKKILIEEGMKSGFGDEGGFAPEFSNNKEPFDYIARAAKDASVSIKEYALGADIAASEFYNIKSKKYRLSLDRFSLTSEEMVEYIKSIIDNHNIETIEDGLSEDDFNGWIALTKKLKKTILVGDDLFTTNIDRLALGVQQGFANAILIKPNQIGTLTETLDVIKYAKENNYKIAISHRSGETNDDFIADLAVGIAADYLKAGAPNRGERLAKYNRILEIEKETCF